MLFQRSTTGKHFSEAARLLWQAIATHSWTADSIADAIGCQRMAVFRYLYGDRLPARKIAIAIQTIIGIDATLWDEAPREPFVPPGARPSTGTDG